MFEVISIVRIKILDKRLFHILIKPPISLSTGMMYERIDRCGFSIGAHSLKAALWALKKMDVKALEKNYYNIFEDALAGNSVHIDRIKTLLACSGVRHSLLSGSGPSVFCTFENKEDAENVFKGIPKRKGMGVFCVKTYRGGIYGNNRG